MSEITYNPPPTVRAMMMSTTFVNMILGPVGSGKTTGVMWRLFLRACEQAPAPDGKRYTRFAIVRQTLKQLEDTVLKDILEWFGAFCEYHVQRRTIIFRFDDVVSEWPLIPLDNPEDQARLLSMQLTGAWMSEFIEMNVELLGPLGGRIGRYPGPALGGATWNGIYGDSNFPTEGSEWHKRLEVNRPANWSVFKQPGGLSEEAENIPYLNQSADTAKLPIDHPDRLARGREYYTRQLSMPPAWVNRYIHARYGEDPAGSAVYRETFKRRTSQGGQWHVSETPLEPVVGMPLVLGQDFGRNPCALIGQMDHRGRLLILQEVVSQDMGLELHLQRHLKPALFSPRFAGRDVIAVGDPAGRQRSMIYEHNSFDIMQQHGLRCEAASTNDIDKRIMASDAMLLGSIDQGPAVIIDGQNCPMLVQALGGMYRYLKKRNGQLAPTPDKSHPWSDLCDDFQYLCLFVNGGMAQASINRFRRPSLPARPRFSSAAWT